MKALVYKEYGPPSVVSLQEVEKPSVFKGGLLIKVHTSTVNRTDAGFRSAQYVVSRLFSGLLRPKYPILGSEFSGIVEEVGEGVLHFQPGDRVFGYDDAQFGGHAEYLAIAANKAVRKIPEGIPMEMSAALTEGSHYALSAIRASGITPGQRAMVYGATGAIGSAAVQLLKHQGVDVVAVCGTKHLETVKQLGATAVVDYQKEDVLSIPGAFDLIFDAVGKRSYFNMRRLLATKGTYISTELGPYGSNIWLALLAPMFQKKVRFPLPVMDVKTMDYLHQLAKEGHFKPLIDRTYAMEDIVEAYTYVESGQKVGNVLLSVASLP